MNKFYPTSSDTRLCVHSGRYKSKDPHEMEADFFHEIKPKVGDIIEFRPTEIYLIVNIISISDSKITNSDCTYNPKNSHYKLLVN